MTTAAYDSIAGWYDAQVRADTFVGDIVLPSLFDLVDDVHGLVVCDLACGQGRVARELARRSACVTGVDISTALIAIAQHDEAVESLGINYVVDDATMLTKLANAQFDGVVCNLALMDMPDLPAVLAAVRRVLRPTGWFVFSITHPCFEAPHARWNEHPDGSVSRELFDYFTEGFWRSDSPSGVRGQVGAQHRTLSTYMNTLAQTGFIVERVLEPQPTGEMAERVPGYRIVPPFLLVRCILSNQRI